MEISEKDVINWLLGIGAAIGALFTALYWYIWRGDRERIRNLETRMENMYTKPEVEQIAERMQHEHRQLMKELRDLRREIIDILKQPWQGDERRHK